MPQEQATSDTLSLEAKALIVLLCAAFYVYAFELNQYLFEHLSFSQGVNWIFIPSGLRLLFVLVFLEAGAVGVVAGSIFVNYTLSPDTNVSNIPAPSWPTPRWSRWCVPHGCKATNWKCGHPPKTQKALWPSVRPQQVCRKPTSKYIPCNSVVAWAARARKTSHAKP